MKENGIFVEFFTYSFDIYFVLGSFPIRNCVSASEAWQKDNKMLSTEMQLHHPSQFVVWVATIF